MVTLFNVSLIESATSDNNNSPPLINHQQFFGCVFQAEVLVSSLGACDQAIIDAGGPQAATPNVGDITVSGGFSSVSHVIHTQCCKWNNGGGEPVRTSLKYIEE